MTMNLGGFNHEAMRMMAADYYAKANARGKSDGGFRAETRDQDGGKALYLEIYDDIDSLFGVGPKQISEAIQDAGEFASIELRLNSPGGYVFDGAAIYNLLKAQKVPVDVYVDGLAASAAGVVAMAGSSITMGASSWLMMHPAWGVAIGNAEDMMATAELLERITDDLVGVYEARAGVDRNVAAEWVANTTWMNGPEAVAAGLADNVGDDAGKAAEAKNLLARWQYENIPAALAQTDSEETKDPETPEAKSTGWKLKQRRHEHERGRFAAL